MPSSAAVTALSGAGFKLWVPRQVLVTPDALRWEHGRAMVDRAVRLGSEIVELKTNRLTGLRGGTQREEYARAKTTLAVTVASESARNLQPIPPSADWQFPISEGCPAHFQDCFFSGVFWGAPLQPAHSEFAWNLGGPSRFFRNR